MTSKNHSRFRGNPEDYLEWFNFGYAKANQIILPANSFRPAKIKSSEIEDQGSGGQNVGNSYSQEYVVKHNKTYMESLKFKSSLPVNKVKEIPERFEDISTIADTEYDDDDIDKDPAASLTHVYHVYKYIEYENDSKLPVHNCKKEILQKIESYPVVVIEGSTGCGKSTQVPQFILHEGFEQWKHVNILVTQPRKIAAISLAKRVCEERGWELGKLVGYQVGLNNRTSADTRLTYVTTEVLVQKAINRKSLSDFTHIILDEIHERDQHTDFALLVVKKLIHTVSRHVKIILMSATIDCAKFADYFASPVGGHLFPAPIISITNQCNFNVQVYYLESLRMAYLDNKMPPYQPDYPSISSEMFDMSINLIECLDDLERADEKVEFPNFPKNRGAVLIFVPGLHAIEAVIERINHKKKQRQWFPLPLHSSFTLDEQNAVFDKMVPGFRKIIVSTNIAESSITVQDIVYVIDFCLTKELNCDPITNYSCLKMAWTSKASCTQRAGRAGRVASGRVYRLVEERFYNELRPHSTPELARTPLSQIILKIKLLDMGEPLALLALALDPPNMTDIHRTILVLKQVGALAIKSEGNISALDGDLTYLGRVAAGLPLDIKLSKLIVMGYLFGCLKETVVIAAALSLKNFHSTPFQDELNAFLSKVSWAYGSFSDCLSLYNAYYVWERFCLKGSFQSKKCRKEREWARSSYVQLEALKEVDKLVKELNDRLEKLKITKNINAPVLQKDTQPFFIKICIAAAFYPSYFKRFAPDDYERTICRDLNGHDPFSTVVVAGLPRETNILYDEQLRKMFKDCSKDVVVSYEGSKAFVQFSTRKTQDCIEHKKHFQDIPGICPTAMHLALKIKQIDRLNKIFALNLFSSKEASERLSMIVSEGKDLSKLKGNKRTVQQCDFELKPPVMPHPSIHVWHILVTHVESPSRFWGISSESQRVQEESYIRSIIEHTLSEDSSILSSKRVMLKITCLAPYFDPVDKTMSYYRARVEEIFDKGEMVGKALMFFLDYGNMDIVDISLLRPLPEKLMDVPQLAIEYSLSEIKPSSIGKGNVENMWSDDAIKWIRNRTMNREFTGKIYSVVHNVIRLEIFDTSGNSSDRSKKSLNNILIEKGFATKAEEFFLSKQNHELRAIFSSEIPTIVPKVSSSMSTYLSVTSLNSSICENSSSGTGIRRSLRGPYSPLEMNFVALTRNGCSKGVRVDQVSVNSVALDLEPQNQYDRLIVSAQVVLNPSESKLVLRGTTLMPALPGMLPLCLLMFSPCVELRPNEYGTQYAGFMCGLGSHPKTKVTMYPEDDIEIPFDFKFTEADLNKINELRYLMSSTLDYFDEITPQDLHASQKVLRDLVLEIMSEKREYMEPQSFAKPYKWNQIQKEDILYPECEVSLVNESMVWPLHCGINLRPETKTWNLVAKVKDLRRLGRRLKEERRLGSFIVNEFCPLCDEKLNKFSDLQLHITLTRHIEKEQELYGC